MIRAELAQTSVLVSYVTTGYGGAHPVVVAGQLGHANPAVTLGHLCARVDRARHADETRERLSARFGHLLGAEAATS